MTRVYLIRVNSDGFTKLVHLHYTNIETEWLSVEIKVVKDKIFVKLMDKQVFVGIQESDEDKISKVCGT